MVVTIFPDDMKLARDAAARLAIAVYDAVARAGVALVAVAGGKTPRRVYELLAHEPYRSRLPWGAMHIFFSDERCVPPDHPESNYRMVQETLLAHVPIPPAQIYRISGELSPEEGAAAYAAMLRDVARTQQEGAEWPRLDLVLLGMGADGHTASLFPGTSAPDVTDRPVTAVYVPALESWRITLTLPVLNAAREVIFLVVGEEKREAVRQVLAGDDASLLPAELVCPDDGTLDWLVDASAASALPRGREA